MITDKHQTRPALALTLLLLVVILACSFSVKLFASSFYFRHLALEDGLPNSTILAQIQDDKGFMWFGTQKGLVRYDGYDFKLYQPDRDDPFSISLNYINTLHQDSTGYLWVGTDGGGLNRFDPKTERFKHYRYHAEQPNSLSNDTVLAITSAGQGKLWIGTLDGLSLLDIQQEKFVRYRHQPDNKGSLSNNQVHALQQDKQGNLWLGLSDGWLNKLEINSGEFQHFHLGQQGIDNNVLHTLSIQNNAANTLWIGTDSSGLFRFDMTTHKMKQFQYLAHNKHSLSSNEIHAIYEDRSGRIWIGTNKGLNLYNPESQSFSRHHANTAQARSLSDDFIKSIFQDNSGMLWFGTWFAGLNILDPSTIAFDLLQSEPSDNSSLVDNIINTLHFTEQGDLWVGGNKGLNLKKKQSTEFTRFTHQPDNPKSLSDNKILSVLVDKQKRLWVGTRKGGLNRWNETSKEFIHYNNDPADAKSLTSNTVRDILQRRNGEIWIATQAGLNRWDPIKDSFATYHHDPDNDNSLSSDYILQLFEDSQQRLWVASRYGGLNLWLDKSHSFKSFSHQLGEKTSLSNNWVTSIIEDLHGDLWIGTVGGGLNRGKITQHNNRTEIDFEHFTSKQGLRSNLISAIEIDDEGYLWISTSDGITRYHPSKLQFKNFGGVEGAQSSGYLPDSSAKDNQGIIYFGGVKGVSIFNPKQVVIVSESPKLAFTEFRLFNQPVAIDPSQLDAPLTQSIQHTSQITLDHKQSAFSFEFSALHFADPGRNQFAYQLVGFDEQWITTDARRRYASYTNLSAGRYRFKVKASNQDGIWNDTGISVDMIILPPWWFSWWALLLEVLLLTAVITGIYRLRISMLKARQVELKTKVDEQTKELVLLGEIGRELTASLNLDEVIENIYQQVNTVFDAHVFLIGVLKKQQGLIHVPLLVEDHQRLQPFDVLLSDHSRTATWCIKNKKKLVIQNPNDWQHYFDVAMPTPLSGKQMATIVYHPLCVGNDMVGCLSIQSPKENAYSDNQLALFETMASYTSVALANALGYSELEKQKVATADALDRVATILNSTDEGFLSFRQDFLIGPEFSLACLAIFNQQDITDVNIADLLFPQEGQAKQTFIKGVKLVLQSNNANKQQLFLGLLPKKLKHGKRSLEMDYRLGIGKIILRLGDVTDRDNLQAELKREQKNHKKIVYAITHKNDLLAIIEDFRTLQLDDYFQHNVDHSESVLTLTSVEFIYRQVHSFKSLFLQIYFEDIAFQLHRIETELGSYLAAPNIANQQTLIDLIEVTNTSKILEQELQILTQTLGATFFDSGQQIELSGDEFNYISALLEPHLALPDIKNIAELLNQKSHLAISNWLSKHSRSANEQAIRLHKPLDKIIFTGDDILLCPQKFNPFMQSLVHIYRNAVAHGLQTAEERELAGKTAEGNITIKVSDNTDAFTIDIEDDGKGIDIEALRSHLIETKVLQSDAGAQLSQQQVLNSIFKMGVSTHLNATIDAGRGVGLPEVETQLTKLHGKVQVKTALGRGTRFTFTLPK